MVQHRAKRKGGAKAKARKKAVVVGGGLVGGVAALALADIGFDVQLVERRGPPGSEKAEAEMESSRPDKSVAKRSVNLALSRRGQEALQRLGLLEHAMTRTVPMYGRALHLADGSTGFQPYDEVDASNHLNSVSREQLNRLLLQSTLRSPHVEVKFGLQLTQVDRNHVLHFEEVDKVAGGSYNDCSPGSVQIKDADLIVGCDGAYSAVREAMMRLQSTNFERRYITHGYKELDIAPDPESGDYVLKPPHALHIWPRGDFMMIALPNPDRSFTCTLYAPIDELAAEMTDEEIVAYFGRNFPDFADYIPDYVDQFRRNPACRLVMSKVDPWHYPRNPSEAPPGAPRMVLLGDAAHAMVPFYGQGMNCGMEDALELVETLESLNLDLAQGIPAFSVQRMPRSNACMQLSLDNYAEMRAHTASRMFLLRKKIEGALNRVFPGTWVPLYKMVAFTRIPYDAAVERERRQDAVLRATTSALLVCSGLAAAAAAAAVASSLLGPRPSR